MIRRPESADYKKPPHPMKRTIRTLLSPEQLNAAMARESSRVDRRAGGTLTLVLFRLGASPAARRGTMSALRLAKVILKRMRITDDLGWFDKDHLGLLLPDTTVAGAWRIAQHVCDLVAKRVERPLVTMYTYGATAPDQVQPEIVRSSENAPPGNFSAVKVAS